MKHLFVPLEGSESAMGRGSLPNTLLNSLNELKAEYETMPVLQSSHGWQEPRELSSSLWLPLDASSSSSDDDDMGDIVKYNYYISTVYKYIMYLILRFVYNQSLQKSQCLSEYPTAFFTR